MNMPLEEKTHDVLKHDIMRNKVNFLPCEGAIEGTIARSADLAMHVGTSQGVYSAGDQHDPLRDPCPS